MKNPINYIQTKALKDPQQIRTVVFAGLATLALFVSMYVFFVGRIVFDVVARRNAEALIQKTQSQISGMQVAYLGQMRNMDISQAQIIGLAESKDTLYASRPSTAASTVGMVNNGF